MAALLAKFPFVVTPATVPFKSVPVICLYTTWPFNILLSSLTTTTPFDNDCYFVESKSSTAGKWLPLAPLLTLENLIDVTADARHCLLDAIILDYYYCSISCLWSSCLGICICESCLRGEFWFEVGSGWASLRDATASLSARFTERGFKNSILVAYTVQSSSCSSYSTSMPVAFWGTLCGISYYL